MTLVGVALLALLIVLIEPLRTGVGNAVQGDTESLRDEIRGLHFGGVPIVLGLALAHAVIWYPAEILDAAAGYVYGFWVAMPLIMAGWLLNAIVAYWIGRHAARPCSTASSDRSASSGSSTSPRPAAPPCCSSSA